MAAARADQSGARRDAPPATDTDAPAIGGARRDAPRTRAAAPAIEADVVQQVLGLVLGNAAARAALDDRKGPKPRPARKALRLASKGLRASYDEHVTNIRFQCDEEEFYVSPHHFCLPRLREAWLSDLTRDTAVVVRDAAAGWPRLRKATLTCASMGAIQEFLCAPLLELEELYMDHLKNHAHWDSILACELLQAARLPLLEKLTLKRWALDSECTAFLATANWPCFKNLHLDECYLDVGALETLATALWAAGLEVLGVVYCNLEEPSCVQELCRGSWAKLKSLRLECTDGRDALEQVLATPWVANLEELDLRYTGLTQAGARLLLDVEWRRLRRLLFIPSPEMAEEAHAIKAQLEARHPGLAVDLNFEGVGI